MYISLHQDAVKEIGPAKLKEWGLSEDNIRHNRVLEVDLERYTRASAEKLKVLLEKTPKLRGVAGQIATIESWLAVLSGEKVRCKKIKQFEPMLKQYLKTAPRHWVYEKRPDSEFWQPYYVHHIYYHPPEKATKYTSYIPPYVIMKMVTEEMGVIKHYQQTFHEEDCEDLTVPRALAEQGYLIESPEMAAAYAEHRMKYIAIHDKVGLQFEAVGVADTDVDTATEEEKSSNYWWRRSSQRLRLDKDGEPARVVIDVRYETDQKESSGGREERVTGNYWKDQACQVEGSPDDDDTDIKPGDEDEDQERLVIPPDVPLCPALVCFDLKRQKRMKIHTDQLTEYKYKTDMADKLILPQDVRDLVDIMVSGYGSFRDIVGKKGGGAVVLCAGPPGTGKTLTSEVYSEAMKRPLYSVQCSQLGLTPDDLEKQLMICFARAARWNAILLLDEADVYVAARGSNLEQNAIVGVFLRVLEYYGGVLFMTTNRSDLVDDAVASRCLARITYDIPTPENQKRIWLTLSKNAGIDIAEREVDKIVAEFPRLSGRDVKNLLKLGAMYANARSKPITSKVLSFVKQFKPTSD